MDGIQQGVWAYQEADLSTDQGHGVCHLGRYQISTGKMFDLPKNVVGLTLSFVDWWCGGVFETEVKSCLADHN